MILKQIGQKYKKCGANITLYQHHHHKIVDLKVLGGCKNSEFVITNGIKIVGMNFHFNFQLGDANVKHLKNIIIYFYYINDGFNIC